MPPSARRAAAAQPVPDVVPDLRVLIARTATSWPEGGARKGLHERPHDQGQAHLPDRAAEQNLATRVASRETVQAEEIAAGLAGPTSQA